MSGKPVWLLDVDGVVNATRAGWSAAPHSGEVFAQGIWWKFRWAPPLVAFIRDTVERGRAEVRWATTWIQHTRELEALFSLPELPAAFTEPADGGFPNGKLQAALTVVEQEHRPLIWTDDDAIPQLGPFRSRLDQAPHGSLLIAPKPNRGLRPEHVEQIDAFLTVFASESPVLQFRDE